MKYRILSLSLLMFGLALQAQQKPIPEKKMYVSPDGKLYINKALPIYLWLSTSPDESSQKYKLYSQQSAKYSNPMYLDADGFNSLRSPSAVDTVTRKTIIPVQDIVFEIYADESAPVTKSDFGDSKPFVFEGKSYIRSNTQLTLTAKDALSGIEQILVSVNGSTYSKYTSPLSFNEEKEYLVKYYAVDNVGNEETVKEIKLFYDSSSPKTRLTINEDQHEHVVSARSKITLVAEDKGIGVSRILYRINDGNENAYQYPISASLLPQGEHKITYYALDKAGNKEAEQSYTFYIDKTPPTIIEEVIAKTFFANGKEYASGKAQLKLTAFDNKAGIKEIRYSINGGEYLVYEKPVFLSQTSGSLNIQTYAVDNVNNKSQSQTANQNTTIPFIDLTGPGLTYNIIGPRFVTRDTLFISRKTKIQLKAADAEAGIGHIEYRINGKENLIYGEPFSIEEEGVHTISYTAYDNVENSSSSSFIVKIDNTGPEVNHQFSIASTGLANGKNSYPAFVTLYLSSSDKVVGTENIKYGFDSNTMKFYTTPITGISKGEKTIKLVAVDKLGNSTEQEIKFIIEP